MKNLLKSSRGASILQMLLMGSLVVAAAGGLVKVTQNQSLENRTVLQKQEVQSLVKDIQTALSDPTVCTSTLGQLSSLSSDATLDKGILNPSGQTIYKVLTSSTSQTDLQYNRSTYQYNGLNEIHDIRLTNYQESAGVSFTQAILEVSIKPFELANSKQRTLFSYTKKEMIPILLVTRDNVIELCLSDEGDKSRDALIDVCIGLGGYFDTTTGICSGVATKIIDNTTSQMCSSDGTVTCEHPYKNKSCNSNLGKDGANHGNWFVDSFGTNGKVNCECVPQPCPSTTNVCFGESLGDDKCFNDCPVGTLTNDSCCSWAPRPSNVCAGTNYTQSNERRGVKCGDTRLNTGIMPINWVPAQSSQCLGVSFQQTKTCDQSKRTARGTAPIIWGPATNTVCAGRSMVQTRTCDGATRVVKGTLDCTCYGGPYGTGCWWPQGKLGGRTSSVCSHPKVVSGRCRASCVYKSGRVVWSGNNSCKFSWTAGPWGSCNDGKKTRRVSCGFYAGCAGAQPSSSESCP